MANFNITLDSVCGGGGHFFFTLSNGNTIEKMVLTKDELTEERGSIDRRIVISRLISFVKEEGGTVPLTLASRLALKTFKV